MDLAVREFVRRRARDRCEFCQLLQEFSELQFHIEHIIPRQHGGADDPENLALACPDCNLVKGPNLTSIDIQTRKVARLFHPRRQRWDRHFTYDGILIKGKTAVGRTTVSLLRMNNTDRLAVRRSLDKMGM